MLENYTIFLTQHSLFIITIGFFIIIYFLFSNFILKKENKTIKRKLKSAYQNQLRVMSTEIITLLNKNILRVIEKEDNEKKKERHLLLYGEYLYKISESLFNKKYYLAVLSTLIQFKLNIDHTETENIDLVISFFKSLKKIYDEEDIFNIINFFGKNYTSSQSEVINLRREYLREMK